MTYLANAGLDPEDIEAIGEVLRKYAQEDADDASIEIGGTRGQVGGGAGLRLDPEGRQIVDPKPGGAQDARRIMATDARLPLAHRPLPTRPRSASEDADFAKRFPEIARIRRPNSA